MKGVLDIFASQGLNVAELCEAAGINLKNLEDPTYRCPTENVSALWEVAIARSKNPDLALTATHLVQPANFEAVGYVMMSCASIREALDRLTRYLRIVSDAARIELVERSGLHWIEVEIHGGEAAIPSQRLIFILVVLLTFFRWGTGKMIRPQLAEFSQAISVNPALYQEVFQCPVAFDKPRNALGFRSVDLEIPLLTSNPHVSEMHDQFAIEQLERLNLSRISYRVKEIIITKLPDGEPRREEIASALCMSEHTLLRRLQDEGITYNQILDATRREIAQRYLQQNNLSLAQITYLLGFADKSNFFRACKRWFDMSPSQYRSQFVPCNVPTPGEPG